MSGGERPPKSLSVTGPTLEQLDDIARARRESQASIDTLVQCEGPCRKCPCCHGEHLISAERLAEWRRTHPIGG